jgi:hypothetical protein
MDRDNYLLSLWRQDTKKGRLEEVEGATPIAHRRWPPPYHHHRHRC